MKYQPLSIRVDQRESETLDAFEIRVREAVDAHFDQVVRLRVVPSVGGVAERMTRRQFIQVYGNADAVRMLRLAGHNNLISEQVVTRLGDD